MWQGSLARALRVSDRSVRYWIAGEHAIPAGVWRDLPGIIRQHRRMLARIASNLPAERVLGSDAPK
jgi:hypothetical protein